MRKNSLTALAALSALLLVACGKDEGGAPPPPEVSVSQPVAREIGDYFVTTGQVAAVESVDVRSRVSGYLVGIHFEDGTEVKQGDLLFEIDPRPYEATLEQAEANLARWEAERRKAEADVARTQKLLPRGAASERDLERWYPDCELGAMPPLGPLYNQPVFVDRAFEGGDIVFDAGSHSDAVRMAFDDFARVVHPAMGDFGRPRRIEH